MSKAWKSALKRIKITKKGKILKKPAGQNHFNTKERGKTTAGKRKKVGLKLKLKNVIQING